MGQDCSTHWRQQIYRSENCGKEEEGTQPKQPLSSTSKVSLDDFDQGVVRRAIASMFSLKKVLPTLNNIRTEPKQSIGYTGSKGRLRKDLLHTKSAYTRCGVNQKVLMERQDVVLSRIRYLRMVRELREMVAQSFIQMKLTFIPATMSRNAVKIVLLD